MAHRPSRTGALGRAASRARRLVAAGVDQALLKPQDAQATSRLAIEAREWWLSQSDSCRIEIFERYTGGIGRDDRARNVW